MVHRTAGDTTHYRIGPQAEERVHRVILVQMTQQASNQLLALWRGELESFGFEFLDAHG
jgi:hypothetical protein